MVKETVPQRCFQPNIYISSPASSHFSHHPNNAQNGGLPKPSYIGQTQINRCLRVRFGLLWWLSGKEPPWQCRRCEFDPWIGKTPRKRKWQPTPILLLGKSHGYGSLAVYSPWGHKRVRHHSVDMNLVTEQQHQRLTVVQPLSRVQLFATPRTAARQASLSFTISWNWLKLMSIELVKPCNHLIVCHPLLLLPPIFPSIRVFSNESVFPARWPKYWSFSFSNSPSNKYSGLISF